MRTRKQASVCESGNKAVAFLALGRLGWLPAVQGLWVAGAGGGWVLGRARRYPQMQGGASVTAAGGE